KYSDVYYKSEYHLDLSVNQRITDKFKIFLQLNNLTDQFENESFGDPAESFSKWTQWAKFGPYGTLGVSFKL
ncbi:MAG TPA: hypothetical protein VF870_08245, partial [Ignavibacteriaceae bacterium]